jgi:hypothetical protein
LEEHLRRSPTLRSLNFSHGVPRDSSIIGIAAVLCEPIKRAVA